MTLKDVKKGRKVRLPHSDEILIVGQPVTPGGMILCQRTDDTEGYYGPDTRCIPYKRRRSDA